MPDHIRWFETLTNEDVAQVGGKNASLGEMIQTLVPEGIRVPMGFATTADAYRTVLRSNRLDDAIRDTLAEREQGEKTLSEAGADIREMIKEAQIPDAVADAIRAAYHELCERYDVDTVDVAVRSSATAEDLPEASFAGQQESFLNIRGEDDLLEACRRCMASLFTDRAIAYREAHGFDHMDVALSVGVQKMIRANDASAGVLFTIDTETGFPEAIVINAAWGLGETVVKGQVTPDQFTVYKPFLDREGLVPILRKERGSKEEKIIYTEGGTETVATSDEERAAFTLSDDEILTLARWGQQIEAHYERPMDIEWAKDGRSGDLFIVQARPETVQSQRAADVLKSYRLTESGTSLLTGQAIGEAIATGTVCIIEDVADIDQFEEGAILVTGSTDPDWVPIMKRAAGIITDHGGRTSHAAIVSRELGVPAILGTETATDTLRNGQRITLSCAEGDTGVVYDGVLDYETEEIDLKDAPDTDTKVMVNVASPAAAMRWWRLPVQGVGLARMEYIINNVIQIHPMALVHPDAVERPEERETIDQMTAGYSPRTDYFVDLLSQGIASIAAPHHPHPVIVRTSDFKTNEYAHLIGGSAFEPAEANPMLGWRGAARYTSDDYREGFTLECAALKRVRETMGFENVVVMIPFCRTLEEADRVLEMMAAHGLTRGENGLEVYVMAEIPSNVTLATEFAERFDGFSIGSNDLTQLVLGVDRDSDRLAYLFDEQNEAVTRTIRTLIDRAHAAHRPVGLCGQAPSDHPDFAAFLVDAGIDSISLTPDSVMRTLSTIAQAEAKRPQPIP